MLCQDLSLIVNLSVLLKKVLRHNGLNLLFIRCNLFSCTFIWHVNHLKTACWIEHCINVLLLLLLTHIQMFPDLAKSKSHQMELMRMYICCN